MKTAGQMLQSARLGKKMDIDDVSRITKIRPQFLAAIEADNYRLLPSGAVSRGFIRNYSEYLGLNPAQILAVFRRDFVENQAGQIVPRGFVEPVSKQAVWTPRTTIIAGVTLVLTLFGFYLFYQYRILTGPPKLQISQLETHVITSEDSYEISGKTDPEATIAVNGALVVLDKGGRFFFRVPLAAGENLITITATSKSGKTTILTRNISFSPI
jgi:cytoskeletal protein RodZ